MAKTNAGPPEAAPEKKMTMADAVARDQERQEEERLAAEAEEQEHKERAYLASLEGGEDLVADVRGFLLDRLRDTQDARPWNQRSEYDQRSTIHAAEETARRVVREVVAVVSANSFGSVPGTLLQVTAKAGFKAVIQVPKGAEHAMDLIQAEGRQVMIVLADPSAYEEHMPPVKLRRDEPILPGIPEHDPETGEIEDGPTAREESEAEDTAAREADLRGE